MSSFGPICMVINSVVDLEYGSQELQDPSHVASCKNTRLPALPPRLRRYKVESYILVIYFRRQE